MIFRSEMFTALELGNTLATSGSRTTTFVPCAKRRAYFPRSPCEKSYSSRIGFRAGLFDVFFIILAFPPADPSCADNANIIASVRVNDNEQFAGKRSAHRDVTRFYQRMIGIGNRERERIAENSGSFPEANAMFGDVRSRFAQVPFEH